MRNKEEHESVTLSFCGGAGEVTGANFLLEGATTSILVDCGLVQGSQFAERINREPFPYTASSIQFLFVTHAHIDHTGRIPKLVRDGFRGTIYSTPETKALTELMLQDALSVMRFENEEKGALLYDAKDIAQALSLWKTAPYHETVTAGEFEAVFLDAGHILGSAMVAITRLAVLDQIGGEEHKRKVVFTGDLGNSPSPLLRDTEKVTDATYLLMESVYGDRNHERRKERREAIARVIRGATKHGGILLVPCFSLEKTQVLLHEMDALFESGAVPAVPVFLDSPLAIRVTDVYRRMTENLNDEARREIAQGDDIFSFPSLKLALRAADSNAIMREPNPKIVIAGSGMSSGGRILRHEEAHLSNSRNTILFVGYQAAGSLGRQIQEGVKKVEINGRKVEVRSQIETIFGYSSHKDSERLLAFASDAAEGGKLERIFLTMGEPKAALFLSQRIRDYVGVETEVPRIGDSTKLSL